MLDCLEFDEALRAGDVLADVAFLAMDLERLVRPELSSWFLGMHRELLGDDWPASLAHHHIAYRAEVRAEVSCIRAAQGATTDEDPEDLLRLALRHVGRARVELVMVGGLPGSGKSTVAAELARQPARWCCPATSCARNSWASRRWSRPPPRRARASMTPSTARTYAELVRRARTGSRWGSRWCSK